MVDLAGEHRKPLLTCWMGNGSVAPGRDLFRTANIPTYRTPGAAVEALAAAVRYRENQLQLIQVPDPLTRQQSPDLEGARSIIENALAERRTVLSLLESKALLAAFHVPITRSLPAHSAGDAVAVAEELGLPVVMKIICDEVTHKTEVGGVRLGLASAADVRRAFDEMTTRVASARPDARIDGVTIEPMWVGRHGRELMIGVKTDSIFGPVISFGLGGTLVEVLKDHAVALPPLNRFLIKSLFSRTRAGEMLGPLRGAPPADRHAVENLLLRVSEMTCELPWIDEMDLNPVIVDEHGATAVDARVVVRRHSPAAGPYEHMAIHPYPRQLVTTVELQDGTAVMIRPIRPEDAIIERDFVNGLSQESRYLRFMYGLTKITPVMLSRFTQIDYDREMALIAVIERDGREEQIAVARYSIVAEGDSCEFAIVVGDAWQGKGLARQLMAALIEAARDRRLKHMQGIVLGENRRMLDLARDLGFEVSPNPDDPATRRIELTL